MACTASAAGAVAAATAVGWRVSVAERLMSSRRPSREAAMSVFISSRRL